MYVFNVALAIICTECTKKSWYTLKHYSIYNYWSKNMRTAVPCRSATSTFVAESYSADAVCQAK